MAFTPLRVSTSVVFGDHRIPERTDDLQPFFGNPCAHGHTPPNHTNTSGRILGKSKRGGQLPPRKSADLPKSKISLEVIRSPGNSPDVQVHERENEPGWLSKLILLGERLTNITVYT